tara:strand:- start:917 stop:1150 length:234 start_codon:yes stop_codon:yes gene_type:complete
MKKKKPTKNEINSDMKDIRIVLSRLLQEMYELKSTVFSYIEFNNDMDKWKDWLQRQAKDAEISNKKVSKKQKKEKIV